MNKKHCVSLAFMLPISICAMDTIQELETIIQSVSRCRCIAKYTGKPSEASLDLNNQCIQGRIKQYANSCEVVIHRDKLISEDTWPFEEGYALECNLRGGIHDKSFCPHFKECAAKLETEHFRTKVDQKQVEKETAILAAIANKDLERLNKFFVPFENAQRTLQKDNSANNDESKNT